MAKVKMKRDRAVVLAEKYHKRFTDPAVKEMLIVQTNIRKAMANYLYNNGFLEIGAVMVSPETDPLCHEVFDTEFEYYGEKYKITKSMILHKLMAVIGIDKFFCFSPNLRLETKETAATGRHLFEFTQLDLEIRGASRDELLCLGENLFTHVFTEVKKNCSKQLEFFGRDLKIPKTPYKRITFTEAMDKYGKDFEMVLSKKMEEPFWLIDIPVWKREFYDKEDPERPGILLDMDIIYPEGYGEGLSGGMRENEYDKIKERIIRQGLNPDDFKLYLELAKLGLPPSGGFGIGIERLTRYICGLPHIKDATLFPKIPGELSL
ncbi:MAG: asparagine synthetase A [candidate division WOR-3 bacterium]